MSDEINKKFLDTIAEVNFMVTSFSPSIAMGKMYISAANSAGLTFHNAANAQQLNFIIASATTVKGVNKILEMDLEKEIMAFSKINE